MKPPLAVVAAAQQPPSNEDDDESATGESSKRSTRSSTRDSTCSLETKNRSRSRSFDEAGNRSRPKRRAASSMRSGSYKNIENVDFSLLEHVRLNDGASPPRSSKKKSPVKSSALISKKALPASLNRSVLLVSDQSLNLAESWAGENTTRKPSSTTVPTCTSALVAMPKRKTAKRIRAAAIERLLPPVLVSRSKDGYAAIPKFLQGLKSSNGKVEIFNRKTGKILKGSQSVTLKNLAKELQAHSEYEPICPEYSKTSSSPSSSMYRQARSSTTARVSGQVKAQCRLRATKVVGRNVLITGGSHKGLFGEFCLTMLPFVEWSNLCC